VGLGRWFFKDALPMHDSSSGNFLLHNLDSRAHIPEPAGYRVCLIYEYLLARKITLEGWLMRALVKDNL
jgi:hypothetical protein